MCTSMPAAGGGPEPAGLAGLCMTVAQGVRPHVDQLKL